MRYLSFWLSCTCLSFFWGMTSALSIFWGVGKDFAAHPTGYIILYTIGGILGLIGMVCAGIQFEKHNKIRKDFRQWFHANPPGVAGLYLAAEERDALDQKVEVRLGQLAKEEPGWRFDHAHLTARNFGFKVMKTRADYKFLFG